MIQEQMTFNPLLLILAKSGPESVVLDPLSFDLGFGAHFNQYDKTKTAVRISKTLVDIDLDPLNMGCFNQDGKNKTYVYVYEHV